MRTERIVASDRHGVNETRSQRCNARLHDKGTLETHLNYPLDSVEPLVSIGL